MTSVDFPARRKLISESPFFAKLSEKNIADLAKLMSEVSYLAEEVIVKEGDFVDSFYIVVKGLAKVFHTKTITSGVSDDVFLATLKPGESIGMSSAGFFSQNGIRTATVVAQTEILLLRLDIRDFNDYLKTYPIFDNTITELTEQILKLDFIKKAYSFVELNNQKVYCLTKKIKEIILPPNTVIFNKDDIAECCYLIKEGKVKIFLPEENNEERELSVLEPSQLFGEAGLLAGSIRNASAKTLDECHLFVLESSLLYELMENNESFSHSIVDLMVRRFRPIAEKEVKVHHRVTKNKREIITLEHTGIHHYYNLNPHGLFIWQQIDGIQTIQDITVAFFRKYKAFAPEMICYLLYNLAEAGFVDIPDVKMQTTSAEKSQTLVQRSINNIKKVTQIKFTFTQADATLTKIYNAGVKAFFTWPAQIILMAIVLLGSAGFFISYHKILQNIESLQPSFWVFLLILIPISFVAIVFHEAAHAFTAKKLGFKIQNLGLGWLSLAPYAYTDTSSLWLATHDVRLKVDIAGIYTDVIIASIFALLSLWPGLHEFSIYFWLVSLFLYYNALKNLSPLGEYDGYFLLTDIFDYPNLRKASLRWLVLQGFTVKDLFKQYIAECFYWISCVVYLIVSTIVTFFVFNSLFKMFSVSTILNIPIIYFSSGIAIAILLIAIFSVLSNIRRFLMARR